MRVTHIALCGLLLFGSGCARTTRPAGATAATPGAGEAQTIQQLLAAQPAKERGVELTFGEPASQAIVLEPPLAALQVGERLVYKGRWMGIPVGWGSIEVREIVEVQGRQAFHIVGEAHSNNWLSKFYPVHDIVHSYVDVEQLHPLRFEKSQHEGHYRSEEVVTFDHVNGVATYESLLNREIKEFLNEAVKHTKIPPHTQDPLSAFCVLRLQPIAVGTPINVDVYSDEKHFPTEVKVMKTLILEIRRRGVFPAVQVEPVARFKGLLVDRGRVYLYMSTDRQRVPLYIQLWTPWGLVTGTIDRDTAARLRAALPPTDRRRNNFGP